MSKQAISSLKHFYVIKYYPDPNFVGSTLKEMLQSDVNDEAMAIQVYQNIIEKARREPSYFAAFIQAVYNYYPIVIMT
jgi:rubrerythrin